MSLENYSRWVKASLADYLSGQLKQYAICYVEGIDDNKGATTPRFEIRIDGPSFRQIGTTLYLEDIYVNILVLSDRGSDVYLHENLIGRATEALKSDIQLYKKGSEEGDDKSLIGCMQPEDQIIITTYGEITSSGNAVQSTVERTFRVMF